MVPADSHRIPRVPRYSGYCYASDFFVYQPFTFYGVTFQSLLLKIFLAISQSYYPIDAVTSMVWALPRSLATTWGIIIYFLFLRVLRCFSSPRLPSSLRWITILQMARLSHSEISGSKIICISPKLFAAYHVLHRLQEPRHPPYALSYLFAAPCFRCGRCLLKVVRCLYTSLYIDLLFTFFACFDSFSFLITDYSALPNFCSQEEFSLLSNMS